MADEKDISRISVGKHSVSVVGLKDAVSRLAGDFGGRSDEEVGAAMFDLLAKTNYIPASAREEYKKSFAREFRKALGQPYSEPAPEGVDIKVLGAGCAQCDKLEQMVMEILTDLNIGASLDHVREMREIARYGVMGVPALVINGKVLSTGTIPSRDKLKAWIADAASGVRK